MISAETFLVNVLQLIAFVNLQMTDSRRSEQPNQGHPIDIQSPGARQEQGTLLETQKLKLNIKCIT